MRQKVQASARSEQSHPLHPREQLLRLHCVQQQLPDGEEPRETHQHSSRTGISDTRRKQLFFQMWPIRPLFVK